MINANGVAPDSGTRVYLQLCYARLLFTVFHCLDIMRLLDDVPYPTNLCITNEVQLWLCPHLSHEKGACVTGSFVCSYAYPSMLNQRSRHPKAAVTPVCQAKVSHLKISHSSVAASGPLATGMLKRTKQWDHRFQCVPTHLSMRCSPEALSMMGEISPGCSPNAASSNSFCISPLPKKPLHIH